MATIFQVTHAIEVETVQWAEPYRLVPPGHAAGCHPCSGPVLGCHNTADRVDGRCSDWPGTQ